MPTVAYVFAFLLGLVIGSFLNVCIYRVPRRESLVRPPSRCPSCGTNIKTLDNIPILSYLLLRGRCRHCGQRISLQYPLVELATGLAFVAVLSRFGVTLTTLVGWLFVSVLILVAVIDIGHKVIPNKVILPGIAVGLALLPVGLISGFDLLPLVGPKTPPFSLAGLVVGGGILLVFGLIRSDWIGGGDIKLNAFIGIFLGFYVLLALFLASLLGSLVSLALILTGRLTRKDMIPFGPFLSLGSLITLFFGPLLFTLYISAL